MSRPADKIIGPSVMRALRNNYEEAWGHQWPYGRRELAELVVDAKRRLGLKPNDRIRADEVKRDALVLMREAHHFPDHEAPYGSRSERRPISLSEFQG
jgi:hypothetical protein